MTELPRKSTSEEVMKRTAATESLECDKLKCVAQAIDNVTRVGATFESGATERFPLPGIAFKCDDEELLLPLRSADAQQLKIRGTVSQQRRDGTDAVVPTAWEVDGDALETRNPWWREFLDDCLTDMTVRRHSHPRALRQV